MKKTLSEQFEHLQENKQVLTWWQETVRRLEQAINGALQMMSRMFDLFRKEQENHHERLKALESQVVELATRLEELSAASGQMQVDLVAVNERQDRMADWAKKLNGKGD